MKRVFMSLMMLLAGFAVTFAEDLPEITFETITHDFGTFPEENGKVSCVFEFTNTGKADLVLQKVRASCGCTTPEWTKEPVKPGEKGVVKATYNATGRPGSFSKTITVTSNAGEKRLSIKGEVIPKAQKVEDKYPHEFGGLRMMKKNVYFNTIFYPEAKSEVIEVINNSDKEVKVSFQGAPKYISVTPLTLKAGEKGELKFVMNTKDAGVWGSFKESINVVVDGKEYTETSINLYGNVAENFSTMTAEEKANAPVLSVGNSISLGKINTSTTKTYEITVKNDGKSNLIIRAINIDSKNATVTVPSKAIKPGKTGAIRFKLNGNGLKIGKFTQRMTVVSNDPNRSVFVINLNGEVE